MKSFSILSHLVIIILFIAVCTVDLVAGEENKKDIKMNQPSQSELITLINKTNSQLSQKELTSLIDKANDGNFNAAIALAHYYGFINRNLQEELKWIRVVAESGSIPYQYNLGFKLIKSENEKEQLEGVSWLKKAANAGLITSQTLLATVYEKGEIIEVNYCKAKKWYEITAYRGDVYSMLKMSDFYTHELCSNNDSTLALAWLLIAEQTTKNELFREKVKEKIQKNISKFSISKEKVNHAKNISKLILKEQ
ncbi:MAG: sel1 repeat family protein [Desulfotalea sp.]